jgi:PAS domain S-box-containing protein
MKLVYLKYKSERYTAVAKEARALEGEKYQAFIQNSHEGIWCCELDEPIPITLKPERQIELMYQRAYLAEANNAMAAMYDAPSPQALIGMRLKKLLIPDDPRNIAYLKAFIKSGYSLSGVDSHELDVHGNEKVFRNSLVGVVKDGKIWRAWGNQQDITEQYRAETELRNSQVHLALALKASHMGTWQWNIETGELIWSDELKLLFGLKPSDEVSYERYVALLLPEERSQIQKKISHAMKTGREYRLEHRVVWKDGTIHWILGQGKAILENGKAVRMIGTSMNIDDLKRGEELKAANVALKMREEQLLALNQSKDEFISLASHQLRTPATVVKQYVGMILQGFVGKVTPRQRSFLQLAFDSNDRELQIINDLLNVARIDAGQVVLNKQKTNLTKLLEAIVEEQASGFTSRSQHIVFDHPEKDISANIDVPRLRMALENIVDNAGKYSPAATTTTLSVTEGDEGIVISIKDEGIGIATADLSKLFQKFSRIENKSSDAAGTGLGLYWAMKVVDLHGGSITVRSRPGKGSTFKLLLPRF